LGHFTASIQPVKPQDINDQLTTNSVYTRVCVFETKHKNQIQTTV